MIHWLQYCIYTVYAWQDYPPSHQLPFYSILASKSGDPSSSPTYSYYDPLSPPLLSPLSLPFFIFFDPIIIVSYLIPSLFLICCFRYSVSYTFIYLLCYFFIYLLCYTIIFPLCYTFIVIFFPLYYVSIYLVHSFLLFIISSSSACSSRWLQLEMATWIYGVTSSCRWYYK